MILEEYDPGGDDVNIILSWRNMIALLMLTLIYFCSKVGDFEVRVEQAKLSQLTVKIFSFQIKLSGCNICYSLSLKIVSLEIKLSRCNICHSLSDSIL